MRSCHCALPHYNPDACKNCSNNQQELSEFTIPGFNNDYPIFYDNAIKWIDINFLKPGRKVKEIVAKFSNGEKKIVNPNKQNLYGDWISEDHKVIHVTHWFELKD
jgi:hypothetical protein